MNTTFVGCVQADSIQSNKYFDQYTSYAHFLDSSDAKLINSVIDIALKESKSKPSTSSKIVETLYDWERTLKQRETISFEGAKEYLSAYTILVKNKQTKRCEECKEQNDEFMKTTIPVSYAIIGSIFFALTCVFITLFVIGISKNDFLMNPWYNMMLFIGCLGITLTDITAACEWRASFGLKKKKNRS